MAPFCVALNMLNVPKVSIPVHPDSMATDWVIEGITIKQVKDKVALCTMMTSSNGNIIRVTGHLCGEFTGDRWIPRTKASDAGLGIFFDLRLNKRLSKQSWCWWFETPSRPLWRHNNATRKNISHQLCTRFCYNLILFLYIMLFHMGPSLIFVSLHRWELSGHMIDGLCDMCSI